MTASCRGCGGYRCNCPDPVYAGVHPVLHQVDPSVEQQRPCRSDPHITGRGLQVGMIEIHAGSNATTSECNHA